MGWKTKPSWGKLKAWTNDTPWFGQTVPWGENETGPPDLTVIEGGDTTPKVSADKPAKRAQSEAAHPTAKKGRAKRKPKAQG